VQGTAGTNGVDGVDGTNGAQGIQGIQGIQGEIGATGTNGTDGVDGTNGSDGLAATIEVAWTSNGTPGSAASVTNTGTTNAAQFGFIIPEGLKGDTGATGTQGIQGIQGEIGPQGTQGIQGVQGTAGTNGVDGVDGTNGAQGIQGIQGIQGEIGPAGTNGTDGADGTNGADGLAATIEVAWTSNGTPGSAASVTNTGTTNAAQFGFIIPEGLKGDTGATGTQGIQGIQGEIGPQGTQGIQGVQGTAGTNGVDGSDGLIGSVTYDESTSNNAYLYGVGDTNLQITFNTDYDASGSAAAVAGNLASVSQDLDTAEGNISTNASNMTDVSNRVTTIEGYDSIDDYGITDAYTKVESDGKYSTGTPVYVESDPVWGAVSGAVAYVGSDGGWTNLSEYNDDIDYATGTPVYVESDPVWESEKSEYATGTPVYAESDPVWISEKGDYTKTADTITYIISDGTNTTARTETNGNERIFKVDIADDLDTNAVWGNITGTLSDQLDLTQAVENATTAYSWGNWALNDSISDYGITDAYTKVESDGKYYLDTNPSNFVTASVTDGLYSASNPSNYVPDAITNNETGLTLSGDFTSTGTLDGNEGSFFLNYANITNHDAVDQAIIDASAGTNYIGTNTLQDQIDVNVGNITTNADNLDAVSNAYPVIEGSANIHVTLTDTGQVVSVDAESVSYGTTDSTAYRGDWGASVSNTASAALPKVGGTMTGDLNHGGYSATALNNVTLTNALSAKSIALTGGDMNAGGQNITNLSNVTATNIITCKTISLAGGQIAFPATAVPSADANTLDDYEEGTWDATLAFGGTSTNITYGSRTCHYVKVGKLVALNGYLALTSKGSSAGDAVITGMPFTPVGNTSAAFRPRYIAYAGFFMGYVGTTSIPLEELAENGTKTEITDVEFADNSSIMFEVVYKTN